MKDDVRSATRTTDRPDSTEETRCAERAADPKPHEAQRYRNPRLGRSQWIVLGILVTLATTRRRFGTRGIVRRQELADALLKEPTLRVKPSAIGPMVTRMLRRFFGLGLVDLELTHGGWARGRRRQMAERYSEDEYVTGSLEIERELSGRSGEGSSDDEAREALRSFYRSFTAQAASNDWATLGSPLSHVGRVQVLSKARAWMKWRAANSRHGE